MRGRTLDIAGATLAIGHLSVSTWLVPVGDRIALPHPVPTVRHNAKHRRARARRCRGALRFHPAGPLLFAAMLVFAVSAAVALLRRSPPMVDQHWFMCGFEAVVAVCLLVGLSRMMRS